jgi:hypothetical protein
MPEVLDPTENFKVLSRLVDRSERFCFRVKAEVMGSPLAPL